MSGGSTGERPFSDIITSVRIGLFIVLQSPLFSYQGGYL